PACFDHDAIGERDLQDTRLRGRERPLLAPPSLQPAGRATELLRGPVADVKRLPAFLACSTPVPLRRMGLHHPDWAPIGLCRSPSATLAVKRQRDADF